MATELQIAEIRMVIMKSIILPDCPAKKEHAIASRAYAEKQFIKILDAANTGEQRMGDIERKGCVHCMPDNNY